MTPDPSDSMPASLETNSSPFDQELAGIDKLTWLPWVGRCYAALPAGRKVLIVGESHYSSKEDPVAAAEEIESYLNEPRSTREMIAQTLIAWDWTVPTLTNLHNLLYSPEDPERFWADLCYYNFIQRPMKYRQDPPERPTWEDFWTGWDVFRGLISVLKPDHILFIGVEAANHFNCFMPHHGHDHVAAEKVEKIGSAHARMASLSANGHEFHLHFIKHCGSYFSTDRWSDYLHQNAREMMASLAISAGVEIPEAKVRHLHVFGMAKSCLDLRGANAPKLELDFLRLASVIRDFEDVGEEAVGYLIVLADSVKTRAEGWCVKYGTGDKIIVKKAAIPEIRFAKLREEKIRNAAGMLQKFRIDEAEKELSVAALGKALGESSLSDEIENAHPGITPLHKELSPSALPLKVAWDYYGTVPIDN